MIFYLVITGFIGAFKAYSDAVALFGTDLNAAEMNTIVGYIYDMLYGNSGGYPSYRIGRGHNTVRYSADHNLYKPYCQQKARSLLMERPMEKHTDYAKIEKQARIRSRVRSTVSAYYCCLSGPS